MKHGIKEIPERYIESRWTKDVISKQYRFGRNVYETTDNDNNKFINQAYYNFEACLDFIRQNKEMLASFVQKTESMLKEYQNDPESLLVKKRTNADMVSRLMGITIPKHVEIKVPNVQNNKGCGRTTRIPSAFEIANQNANKQSVICSVCRQIALHNARTCPQRKI